MSADNEVKNLKKKLAEKEAQLEEVQEQSRNLKFEKSLIESENRSLRSRPFIGFNPSLGGMRVTFGCILGLIIFFLIPNLDGYLDPSSMENVWLIYKWVYWPGLLIYSVIGYLKPE